MLSRLQALPFRWQLTIVLVSVALLAAAVPGVISYRTTSEQIRLSAIRAVGIAADGRERVLTAVLRLHHQRATYFVELTGAICKGPATVREACLREALEGFLATSAATAGRLVVPGMEPLLVGDGVEALAALPPYEPEPGQLTRFVRADGALFSVVQVRSGDRLLALRFGIEEIEEIFSSAEGLGESGETFLADADGFFLTRARYPSNVGHSHPIDATPMRTCLARKDGEMVAPDYRAVPVVHGFRYIEEIGGGCIMAHLDEAEAFAPANRLLRQTVLWALAFSALAVAVAWALGRLLTRPIERLTERAGRIQAGDLESPVPTDGPAELRTFARTFAIMADSLRASRENMAAQARKLEEAVRLRDEFLSVASHELKTPVTSLLLQLQSLQRAANAPGSQLPPRLTRGSEIMHRQVQRMTRLVDELLDVSRVAHGKLVLERERVELSDLAREMIERLKGDLDNAGCPVKLEAPEPVVGHWDRLRLEQVASNLLGNAMKYGRGAPIHVSVARRDDRAVLSVHDQGIGVRPEDQARIFERFERAVSSQSFGGLGLGLYITREIVEAHGGSIRVESVAGEAAGITAGTGGDTPRAVETHGGTVSPSGSTFIVELPLGTPPPST